MGAKTRPEGSWDLGAKPRVMSPIYYLVFETRHAFLTNLHTANFSHSEHDHRRIK